MARPSVRDLVEGLRAKAQAEGSDPQRLPGAVYGAKDVAISLGRPETRTWHPNDPRPVIVVSSPRVAQSVTAVGVHVVPCSSQIHRATRPGWNCAGRARRDEGRADAGTVHRVERV